MGLLDIFSAPKWANKAQQPALVSRATLDRVVLHVTWVGSVDQLPDPNTTGHTRLEQVGDEWHAYVMCVQPADFNDFDHLETLGHECWHALGAQHETTPA